MTNYEDFIKTQTEDLMTDISRILGAQYLDDNEKMSYIKSYSTIKLNVVFTDGKLDGMEEAKNIYRDAK